MIPTTIHFAPALRGLRCAGALLAGLALLAVPAAAEVRVLEVVGAVPLDAASRAKGMPKDRAIEEALWEGVSRVAEDLLVDSVLPESASGAEPLRGALGRDMVPYTRSFRIVDDQGERPMLFTEHPDAATEYVVVVEVQVEVERVRERLVAARLLADEGRSSFESILLEVRDLDRYEGYDALVRLLRSPAVGAASVTPRELERGRSVLSVQGEWGAADLLERLLASAPPEMQITPLRVQAAEGSGQGVGSASGGALVISLRYAPPDPGEPGRPAPRN